MGAHVLLLYHACPPFPAKLHTYCRCVHIVCANICAYLPRNYSENMFASPLTQSSHMYDFHCLLFNVVDIFA